jgi:hypothetical protein
MEGLQHLRQTTELYDIFIFRSGYCCHGSFLHQGIKVLPKV